MPTEPQTVLVTGGAGYVGAVLVPKLLAAGHRVRVLDLFLYGDHVFDGIPAPLRANLTRRLGDIRDRPTVAAALEGCHSVIHLACISNDPSFELNPELGRSINYDAFEPLVQLSRDAGVRRFVYASSSSVYGIKDEERVTEDLPLEPLTDYSKYKALCEEVLARYTAPDFATVTVRPATVCGYSPRQRLDLVVNILTNHAVNRGKIRVFGGRQYRPNIHIDDVTDLYVRLLELPDDQVSGKVWNAGYEDQRVSELADIVREVVGDVAVETEPTDDLRSYRVCSEKIREDIGFVAGSTTRHAVQDLVFAFRDGRLPNPLDDERYYNLRQMQRLQLS